MRTLLSRPIQVDPTFHIGLGVVVILALAEVFATASYYAGRARAARASSQPIAIVAARTPSPSVAPATPAPAVIAQPSVSPAVAAATPAPSLVDQLLREGIEKRDRGDTATALKLFEEASESNPNNADLLAETAKTYDLMQNYDRANELWGKIKEIGPSAGAAYELADQRLKVGVETPAAPDSTTTKPATDTTAESHTDVGGSPEGPIMAITGVKLIKTPDPDADADMALQIGIKRQPDATVDHTKVKILVFIYDIVDDKDIKLTDADVSNEWLTATHDWSGTDPEVLSVKYLRPKTPENSASSSASAPSRRDQKHRGKSPATERGQRKYLGYIVRVYYDDELQAVQADPARLLRQFPNPNSSPR